MKLTILQTGDVPEPLRPQYGAYHAMFQRMFDSVSSDMSYEVVVANANSPLPNASRLQAIVITGSPAGVYDDLPWIEPLRAFVREAYEARIPMLGVCFGHQIMADALGGEVRKSEKGWGLGRHSYGVVERPAFMADAPDTLSIACSHQDQVITPPEAARVILSTAFTPNAGLYYETGKALSFQPHPEFEDDYAMALAEMRRDRIGAQMTDHALSTFATASDSRRLAEYIVRFFKTAGAAGV
ncbi:MAG: gamma-glutamyl-gamma-aminobutyrate hydrolase family protein [Devosia sp.]|nr:gamma-glutamyl-gamma-aminobutyrate hydrolase family protein [Devosia sp.]